MASIRKTVSIDVPPEFAWDALRDVGNAHVRLFPGVLSDARLEGDERTVTFRDGPTFREAIVDCDDASMRFAYAILGGRFRHYAAAFAVVPEETGTRVEWTVDLLPNEAAPTIASTMERGLAEMRMTLERAYHATP